MTELNDFIAQAASALLQDSDTKSALLDYLKTITEAARSKPTQRIVWEQLSLATRKMRDRQTAANDVDHVLYLVAFYDDVLRVGVIVANPVSYRDELPDYRWFAEYGYMYRGDMFRKIIEGHYTEVITAAQACMPEAIEAWDAWLAQEESA